MTKHEALSGAQIHEWKGASSADDNTVYVADGAGSGSWELLFEETNTADFNGTSSTVDVEGLGDYAAIRVTVPCIRSASNDNTWFYFQAGNDTGFTTSTVYYSYYHNNSTFASLQGYSQAYLGFTYTSAPSTEQSISFFISNFNKPYYSVGYSSPAFLSTPQTPSFFIREQKAYNKIRFTHARVIAAGAVSVLGLKG